MRMNRAKMSHSYYEGNTERNSNNFVNMKIKRVKNKNMGIIPYLKGLITQFEESGMHVEADAAERRLEMEKSKSCIGRSCNTVKRWIGYGTRHRKRTHRRKSRSRRTRRTRR